MKEETMGFKDLIMSIQAMRAQAETLLANNNTYNKLLQVLISKDFYDENNEDRYFSSKELQELTGLSHQKIKSQMEQIHDEIFKIAFDNPDLFNFKELIYAFYVKGWRNSINFKGKIPIMPRVGDDFEFPFLRAFNNGMGNFFVSRIQHEFTDKAQIIHVWLEAGIYNSYEKFKKDKDDFENHERWLRNLKNST
ncbi:MAG: hypothetical protein J0M08_02610 [Bacteroidetes bacterium]|nr:hypothetical protein [Bacteroidota bacterium]